MFFLSSTVLFPLAWAPYELWHSGADSVGWGLQDRDLRGEVEGLERWSLQPDPPHKFTLWPIYCNSASDMILGMCRKWIIWHYLYKKVISVASSPGVENQGSRKFATAIIKRLKSNPNMEIWFVSEEIFLETWTLILKFSDSVDHCD